MNLSKMTENEEKTVQNLKKMLQYKLGNPKRKTKNIEQF